MGGKAPKVAAPVAPDIGKDITSYVKGYTTALPTVIGAEREYRPQFGDLNLADISQYQQGIQAIQGDATQTAQRQLSAARGAEFADMGGQTDLVRNLLGGINPEGQRAMVSQAALADQAYASSQNLTPQERRASDQATRESFGSAGRLGGNYAVGSELLSRDSYLTGKRQNAFDMLGQSYNTSQNFAAPAFNLLSGMPTAYGAGQDFTQFGMGLLGQSTPQMINPDTGVGIASAHAQNVNNANMANATSKASNRAGQVQMGGAIIGAGVTAFAI